MYALREPTAWGGVAAAITMLAYPPIVNSSLAIESQQTGQPLGPCKRLIQGWLAAIHGAQGEAERLRGRSTTGHPRSSSLVQPRLPSSGRAAGHRADDPAHTVTMDVVFLSLVLSGLLPASLTPPASTTATSTRTRGARAYGIAAHVPSDIHGLHQTYETIVVDRLHSTSLGDGHAQVDARSELRKPTWL
jgi:hypothetical protein